MTATTRIPFRFAPGLALAILVTGCGKTAHPRSAGPPNVIIVTLDTTRADRIGAFGGSAVPTPNLDRAAKEGTRFLQTISPVPLTLPAHSSMFTGLYPFRHGVRHNGAYHLPQSAVTLAERLKEAGYRTGAFVGAFVLDASFGLDQGFDSYSGVSTSGAAADFLRPSDLQRPGAAVNDAATHWISASDARPFFAWIHYYDAHYPYAPPEDPALRLDGQGYEREISYIDHCFGKLTEFLAAKGLADDTILVVAGDHGESLGSHGERTHGIFLYEPDVHVPFFVRAPGRVDSARAYRSVVSLVDVAPTVLALLGLPPLAATDGLALWDARGRLVPENPDRMVYGETLMPRIELGWSDLGMMRDGRFKFVRAPRPELYDLSADPLEQTNLFDASRDRSADYSEALDATLASGTDASGVADASNALSREELSKLQSLGYLRGSVAPAGTRSANDAPDPKDRIGEAVRLEEADEALERGQLAEAIAKYDEVGRSNPRNHTALQGRARALLRDGDLRQANDAALAALAAAGSDAFAPPALTDNARALLATILSLQGKTSEAAAALRESGAAGKAAPPRSPASVLMAGAKNEADAKAILALAVRTRPGDPWTWAASLEYCRRTRQPQCVENARRELAQLGAASAAAFVDAGTRAQAAGDLPLATSLYEAAVAAVPNHPDLLGYLATARLAAGNLDAAETAFRSVLELRPEDPRAAMYLSEIALLRGDEAKAREWIDRALQKSPGFVPPLLNYARWLAEKGRAAEALRVAESALARRPGDPETEALLRELRAAGRVS